MISITLLLLLIGSSIVSGQVLETNLPIVIINTNGQEIPDEPKISAEMGIIDNGPGEVNHQNDPFNDYDGFVGIEMRGQSTQFFYPKKSYSFETRNDDGSNLDVSILGMPEENDWILYGPYGDKSMLRNMFTFWMARMMDVYASRTVFCEVIINGEYMGVYVMMEKIKKDDERVSIAKLRPEDNSGDELTGGYIIRVDKVDDYFQWGLDGWLSYPDPPFPNAMTILYQYYYPKSDEITSFQKNYIQNYILETENALIANNFHNADVGYNLYLNTGSFAEQLLLFEISKEVDGYRYSTYFYKEKDSDGGKLFAGPAWDFNLGYANVDYWDDGVDIEGWHYEDVEPVEWSIMFWWKRLMQDYYFNNLAKTKWLELREGPMTDEKITFFIDSITLYIDEAQQRNYEKWPILGEYVWPNYDWQNNDYEDEVAFFEEWLFDRIGWMDNNLPGVELNPAAQLSLIEDDVLEIALSDDYFSRTYLKNQYFVVNDAPPDFDIDTVVYVDASTVNVYFDVPEVMESEISITIDKKVINSFNNLTTSTVILGTIEGEIVEDGLKVFMSASGLTIECKAPEKLGDACLIFDVNGKLVEQHKIQPVTENRIRIDQPAGIYFCLITFESRMITKKVLVW